MRILLVEDDDLIARDITAALGAAGYVVERERGGEEALFRGDTEDYAAVLLDLGLPGMDGLSILRRWRADGRTMPILILSARAKWSERVEAIDAGADDYLPKPFRMEEMLARLRAIVRRAAGQITAVIAVGDMVLDTRQMRVARDGVPISLTPQEYRVLSYLMHHAGRVVPHTEMLDQLYANDSDKDSNAIEVLVGRIRRKIGGDLIETRRGFGYIVNGPAGS
jgi:two-component system, OmpR family, response regulator